MGTIESLAKAVERLNRVRQKQYEVDLTLDSIVRSVTMLLHVLDKFDTWLRADTDELHHQLLSSLGSRTSIRRKTIF